MVYGKSNCALYVKGMRVNDIGITDQGSLQF